MRDYGYERTKTRGAIGAGSRATVLVGAPTTALEPHAATDHPKRSPDTWSEAVSFACRIQPVLDYANTYEAPENDR